MSKPKKPFILPKAFITQLQEFSKGFYLVTLDDTNNFAAYTYWPDSLTELGMINFVDIHSMKLQEALRDEEDSAENGSSPEAD